MTSEKRGGKVQFKLNQRTTANLLIIVVKVWMLQYGQFIYEEKSKNRSKVFFIDSCLIDA